MSRSLIFKNEQVFVCYISIVCLFSGGMLRFQALPLLQIDGKNLVQTNCIAYFLARKADMVGQNEEEITL